MGPKMTDYQQTVKIVRKLGKVINNRDEKSVQQYLREMLYKNKNNLGDGSFNEDSLIALKNIICALDSFHRNSFGLWPGYLTEREMIHLGGFDVLDSSNRA